MTTTLLDRVRFFILGIFIAGAFAYFFILRDDSFRKPQTTQQHQSDSVAASSSSNRDASSSSTTKNTDRASLDEQNDENNKHRSSSSSSPASGGGSSTFVKGGKHHRHRFNHKNSGAGKQKNTNQQSSPPSSSSSSSSPPPPPKFSSRVFYDKTSSMILQNKNSNHNSNNNSLDDTSISENEGSDYSKEDPSEPLLKTRVMSPPEKMRKFLKNIVLMHMLSPSRYELVPLVKKHYAEYFSLQVFTGPQNATIVDENVNHGTARNSAAGGEEEKTREGEKLRFKPPTTDWNKKIKIRGYDVNFGRMQYTALAGIIELYENSKEARRELMKENDFAFYNNNENVNGDANDDDDVKIEGYLFLGDDLILHPWMLYGRNKNVAWCSGMGIGNVHNWQPVKPVPAMSAEKKFQKGNWPFWFSARAAWLQIYDNASLAPLTDAEGRASIAKSVDMTPADVFKWSAYRDAERKFCCTEKYKPYHLFYTIVDVFYVPTHQNRALRWVRYTRAPRRVMLHLETAIPTTLRMISPTYEVLRIQYYWSSVNATRCKRTRWAPQLDGFHRCRHDHEFVTTLFERMSHDDRRDLVTNTQRRAGVIMQLNGLDKSWNPRAYSIAEENKGKRREYGKK